MNDFITGAIVALCGVAALYFWHFRRQTGERFFALFAFAFATLGLNFTLLAVGDRESEFRPGLYLVRLAAFLLIIAAIVEQNRRSGERR
jgi:uncharacterized membrane protein